MFDERVRVLSNERINGEYWKIVFATKRKTHFVKPGQFLNLHLDSVTDPFLRRPFSYYRVSKGTVEVLYEILGKGTKLLTHKKKGDEVTVLGPLGKPFSEKIGKKKRVLIAGGVGVPPLVFLAERCKTDYLLIGCGTRSEVLPKSELKRIRADVLYATDDGTYGKKGFVTAILAELLLRENPQDIFIQTCGPHAMMDAVMKIAKQHDIAGEASIDERMACGVGACLGCVVETKSGFKTSCVEGPIFKFSELTL